MKKLMPLAAIILSFLAAASTAHSGDFIILQSTTSTHNSGLYRAILPQFEKLTGISVRVIGVGTGQAIRNAQQCDGDVLLVHSRAAEDDFVAQGFGDYRRDVMYNDFVVIGPSHDPAGLLDSASAADAFAAIKKSGAESGTIFVSRGDSSGTHLAELKFWSLIGVDANSLSNDWYKEVGNGMGATLNIAVEKQAYTLSDRATWLAFNSKQDAIIAFQGDPILYNQYGIIPISKTHCPSVKYDLAARFIDWILSPLGQAAIADYRRGGAQLFFPNAGE